METARAEAQHAAAGVGEREDEAAGEVVVAAPVDQAGGHELVLRVALLPRLVGEPVTARRKAEAEVAADLLGEAPLGQVGPHRLPGRGVPEVAL